MFSFVMKMGQHQMELQSLRSIHQEELLRAEQSSVGTWRFQKRLHSLKCFFVPKRSAKRFSSWMLFAKGWRAIARTHALRNEKSCESSTKNNWTKLRQSTLPNTSDYKWGHVISLANNSCWIEGFFCIDKADFSQERNHWVEEQTRMKAQEALTKLNQLKEANVWLYNLIFMSLKEENNRRFMEKMRREKQASQQLFQGNCGKC